MREKTPTKSISLALPMVLYEELKVVAEENEISVTKTVNSIVRGYLKARAARKAKEEAND